MHIPTRPRRVGRAAAVFAVGVLAFSLSGSFGSSASAAEPIEVRVGDSTIVEGNPGQNGTASFGVRLSAPAATDTYVYFHTVAGSASPKTSSNPGGDFAQKAAPTSKIKIALGKTVGNIGVAAYPDTAVEGDESFTVVIDYATTTVGGAPDPGYTIARGTGTGTIVDDDPAPGSATIDIGDTVIPEGNPTQKGPAKLSVRLSQAMATDEYVYFQTVPGSATDGVDYATKAPTSKVKIALGKTAATITTQVLPDVDGEQSEAYTVVIVKVTPVIGGAQDPLVSMGDTAGQVTILDDDVPDIVPDAPTGVTASLGTTLGDADVWWTAPAPNGGSPIDSYSVEYTTDGGFNWWPAGSVSAPTTSGTFLCGPGGTTCSYRVIAHNGAGYSSPSSASNDVTVPSLTAPGAPENFDVQPHPLFGLPDVVMSWDAPSSGGAPDGYTIEFSNDDVTYALFDTPSENPVTYSLAPGTYYFRVNGFNGAGDGPPSNVVGPITISGGE
ncbi:MAG: fibronectin type III domain-containing protein [Actinobacteria bacterium]|nr:fibronectin type III domain-containing protein [Actinomycetota bacterium]